MKYNNEFKEKVINEYKKTNKKSQTCKKFEVPLTTFNHWLINKGKDNSRKTYSKELKKNVIEEYKEGMTIKDLSDKYNIIEGTINLWIKPVARKRGVQNSIGIEDFFDNIDSEKKAYYLGWIMADGNVSIYNNQYSLKLHIGFQDKHIIDDFLKDIKATYIPKEKESILNTTGKKHKSYYVSLTSKHMIESLISLGVIPNKTGKEFIPNIPKRFLKDFLRGFFDGDGITSIGEKNKIGFVSSKYMIIQILELLKWNLSIQPHHTTPYIYYFLTSSKDKIKDLYNYMYKDANVFIKRKHDRFKFIMENTEVAVSNSDRRA
jgi:transposase-like protein/intein-encoded DNA endonuclease-like protein